jgi:4-amino-4-deoxy-L-arabinose transferase-like glycosyltransferase
MDASETVLWVHTRYKHIRKRMRFKPKEEQVFCLLLVCLVYCGVWFLSMDDVVVLCGKNRGWRKNYKFRFYDYAWERSATRQCVLKVWRLSVYHGNVFWRYDHVYLNKKGIQNRGPTGCLKKSWKSVFRVFQTSLRSVCFRVCLKMSIFFKPRDCQRWYTENAVLNKSEMDFKVDNSPDNANKNYTSVFNESVFNTENSFLL